MFKHCVKVAAKEAEACQDKITGHWPTTRPLGKALPVVGCSRHMVQSTAKPLICRRQRQIATSNDFAS